eukprot:PhF_6_TR40548/c0_g1_i1/m.60768
MHNFDTMGPMTFDKFSSLVLRLLLNERNEVMRFERDVEQTYTALGGGTATDVRGGTVMIGRLRKLCTTCHLSVSLDALVQEMDTDGSGKLEFDEVETMLKGEVVPIPGSTAEKLISKYGKLPTVEYLEIDKELGTRAVQEEIAVVAPTYVMEENHNLGAMSESFGDQHSDADDDVHSTFNCFADAGTTSHGDALSLRMGSMRTSNKGSLRQVIPMASTLQNRLNRILSESAFERERRDKTLQRVDAELHEESKRQYISYDMSAVPCPDRRKIPIFARETNTTRKVTWEVPQQRKPLHEPLRRNGLASKRIKAMTAQTKNDLSQGEFTPSKFISPIPRRRSPPRTPLSAGATKLRERLQWRLENSVYFSDPEPKGSP